jgi:hypothetical protein
LEPRPRFWGLKIPWAPDLRVTAPAQPIRRRVDRFSRLTRPVRGAGATIETMGRGVVVRGVSTFCQGGPTRRAGAPLAPPARSYFGGGRPQAGGAPRSRDRAAAAPSALARTTSFGGSGCAGRRVRPPRRRVGPGTRRRVETPRHCVARARTVWPPLCCCRARQAGAAYCHYCKSARKAQEGGVGGQGGGGCRRPWAPGARRGAARRQGRRAGGRAPQATPPPRAAAAGRRPAAAAQRRPLPRPRRPRRPPAARAAPPAGARRRPPPGQTGGSAAGGGGGRAEGRVARRGAAAGGACAGGCVAPAGAGRRGRRTPGAAGSTGQRRPTPPPLPLSVMAAAPPSCCSCG